MADSERDKLLWTLQVSFHHAVENQAVQWGEKFLQQLATKTTFNVNAAACLCFLEEEQAFAHPRLASRRISLKTTNLLIYASIRKFQT